MEVVDTRTTERYVVAGPPLPGSYGSASVGVLDISALGAQVEHAQPLRLGTRARFWFKRGDVSASVQALIIWSHLSKTPNDKGKYLYRSGLRIETELQAFARAVQSLLEDGVLTRDTQSLEKKRRREVEKINAKQNRPVVKLLRTDIDLPPDQLLLVQHARERLRHDPDESQRWYQRARYAITQGAANVVMEAIPNREEVLAVWEYLERSIDISTIVKVFDRNRSVE